MPRKCSVPLCKANYNGRHEFSTYRFPKEPEMREKWLKAICRRDFVPTPHSCVCIQHFEERFIEREMSAIRDDGSVLTVPLSHPRLKKNSYPTIFSNFAPYEFLQITYEDVAHIKEETENNTSFQDEDHQSGEEDGEDYSKPEGENENEANEKEDNLTKLCQHLKSSRAIREIEKVTPQLSIPFNSSGRLSIKPEIPSMKPLAAKKPYCKTCDIDFDDTDELHVHLVEHVKLPYIVLTRLESEDEDEDNIDNWSDEEIEQEAAIPSNTTVANLDILKKLGGGIRVNKPTESFRKEHQNMEQTSRGTTKSTIEKINTKK